MPPIGLLFAFALVAASPLLVAANLDFFMDAGQTEQLYGVRTDRGIYYVRGGLVNQYAMTFQDQVR